MASSVAVPGGGPETRTSTSEGARSEALEHAAQAYHHAGYALAGASDELERVKLNYCFGKTLLQLSDGKDLELATEARTRLKTALNLARVHMPDGV